MADKRIDDSLIVKFMQEIGPEGRRYYPIDNFVPMALSSTSDLLTKRLILLLIAARSNHQINDIARLEKIVEAIAQQDPTAAFTSLFQAYDISLDNPPERRLPMERFVCDNAIPMVTRLPESDLPFCAAFVFESAAHILPGEKAERLVNLAQALLDRLDQSFPGESERLWQHLISRRSIADDPESTIPVNPVVRRIFTARIGQPERGSPGPGRCHGHGALDI